MIDIKYLITEWSLNDHWTGQAPPDINDEPEYIILFFILQFGFRLCDRNNQSMTKASMRCVCVGGGVSMGNPSEEVGRDK